MNTLFKKLALIAVPLSLLSCDKKFEEMNRSVDLVTSPTLEYMIPTIQLNLIEKSYYTHYTMLGILSQQIQGANMDSYKSQGTTMAHLFDDIYPKTIKNVVDVIEKTKGDPELVNFRAMASIMRAYEISRMTDAYGDVPYSEAGLGYEGGKLYPKYDSQQDIYNGIIAEIKAAIKAFDPAKKPVPAKSDLIYKGNYEKWKKLGNSLLLRYGMRMVHADPAKAKETVLAAIAGGVMQQNDESFVVYYLPDTYYATTANGNAAANKYDYKLTNVFVDLLKNTNDPRLSVYAMLPDGTTIPEMQKGFKLFESDNTSKKIVSTPNTTTYARFDAPYVHMSYAETEFMMAEAMLRGWTTGDAAAHFQKGLRANLELQSIYGDKGRISPAAIDAYIASAPFDTNNVAEALKTLHTQMWIMFYYNWNEAFAHWRRTGVPSFSPTVDKNLNRRLIYPQSEWNTNTGNLKEAIARQGDDNVMTRIWWDKK
jgi:hypothetical protein